MIKVGFRTDSHTIILSLTGHAGAGDYGKDIVCSAGSILAYTAAQTVADMWEEGELSEEPEIRLASGDAYISCTPTDRYYSVALHAFTVIQTGFALLAGNNPQCVELKPFDKGSLPLKINTKDSPAQRADKEAVCHRN